MLVIIFQLIISIAAASTQGTCLSLFEHRSVLATTFPNASERAEIELYKMDQMIENNLFTRDRSLLQYVQNFPGLEEILNNFPKHGVWMDVGAGDATAMRYFIMRTRDVHKGRFFAFSVNIPSDKKTIVKLFETSHNFKFIEGHFETLNLSPLPLADVITDYYGAGSYARLDLVLKNSLNQLHIGGDYFQYFKWDAFTFETSSGEKFGMLDYIKRIKGVEIVSSSLSVIHLRRTENIISIPELELITMHAWAPPTWNYLLLHEN